tara:strand:+ start:1579 stop:2853 length:1275 start_codon:yes stop_codon:yes gene_type:complete
MALKKPGDFFQRKEVVKLKEEIDQLVNPELSELSSAFDNYKEKVNKFELLSGVIEDVQKELKDIKVEVYKKEELEETVIKSSLLLEKKIKEIKEDVEKESKNVLSISSIKHRKLEEDIKIYHDKALSVIQNEVGKFEEGQKSYNSKLSSIRSEIFRTEDLKKVTEKVKEDLAEFQKVDYDISEKIKYMEDVFVKFNEQVTLKENVITEPPSTDNVDPLTPLDQKFVTFDKLSEHYQLFINRIQRQLSTLGGGGAVRIQDMDDIDLSTAKVNNKFLKYDSATNKWLGADASVETVNIIDDTSPQLGGNLDLNSKNITGTGNIDITGTVTATDINSASDIKLKKNIKAIENPISKIMGIEGVSFNWKSNNKPSLGVTADHLQNILPELVKEDDIKSVNYNGLVGLLIECVKNQQQQIDELKDQLNN